MGISTHDADRLVADLARDQHGVLHRRQLLAEGLSYDQIDGRLERASLIALGSGVLAVRSAPATERRQYKAAELSIAGAALSGLAAARLHDLGATRSAAPELVVHPSSTNRSDLARVRRRLDVDTTAVDGIAVTTVAQTLVDIVDRLRIARVDEVWTSALVRRRTSLDALTDRVEACRSQRLRHRGTATAMLGSLVDGAAVADSELEVRLLRIAASVPGVPPIVPQLSLPWWRGGAGRGDVGIPEWRLILEADGRAWHSRLADFDDDRRRDNLAAANGYQVLRFSAVHLQREPDDVAATIAATGRHRRSA